MTDGRRYAWARVPHFYYGYYVYKYSTSGTYSGFAAQIIQHELVRILAHQRDRICGTNRDELI